MVIRFLAAEKKFRKMLDCAVKLAVISVMQWKLMSTLASRAPTAESVAGGTRCSLRVASGLIWGPIKRTELHFDSSSAMPRLVIAREQAGSQLREMVVSSEGSRM